ncbi:hypothetical protein D3Z36_02395 [Lachnospiraceae bacterium]|nr:hypothetical protein [Lachnospiraceae bacterium]
MQESDFFTFCKDHAKLTYMKMEKRNEILSNNCNDGILLVENGRLKKGGEKFYKIYKKAELKKYDKTKTNEPQGLKYFEFYLNSKAISRGETLYKKGGKVK